jgi:hypothetical protein
VLLAERGPDPAHLEQRIHAARALAQDGPQRGVGRDRVRGLAFRALQPPRAQLVELALVDRVEALLRFRGGARALRRSTPRSAPTRACSSARSGSQTSQQRPLGAPCALSPK